MNGLTTIPEVFRSEPPERRIAWIFLALLAVAGMLSTAIVQTSSIAIIILFGSAVIRGRSSFSASNTLIDLALFFLVIARIISVLFSIDQDASVLTFRVEIPFYLLLFAALWLFRGMDDASLRFIIRLLVVGALLASLIGIVIYATGIHHRARSITSGYYTLGMYLTAIFGLLIGLGPHKDYFRSPVLWYGSLLVLAVGILFTFNRVHWVILGVLIVIMGIYRDRKLLAGFAIVVALAFLFSEPLQERILTLLAPSSSMSDRDVLWREGMKLIGDRPLTGFGTRTFEAIFPEVPEAIDPGVGSWHNDMLQIYLESGFVALIGYFFMMVIPLWLVLQRIIQKGRDVDPQLIGVGLLVFAVFLGGLAGIFFSDPIIAPLTYISIALVVVLRERSLETE